MDKKILGFLIAIPLCATLVFGFSMHMDLYTPEPPTETAPEKAPPVQESIDWADVFLPVLPEQTEPRQDETTPGQTQPTETVPAETVPPVTETQPPAVAVPPTTVPEIPDIPDVPEKMWYTREELEALDNTLIVYGPGLASNGDPAPYAPGAQEKYGKYAAHFIEDAPDTIYLTFDCGYEYYVDGVPLTGKILDTLKAKNVKALFFVTGSYVENNPQLVQRIIDEGHALGSHSADHHSMPSLTIDEMEEQIMTMHNYVKEYFGYSMKFFRPPSGEFSERSLAVTQNLGYETVHWSFAYADWDTAKQPDPKQALQKILACHHDGAIYLLHAVSATNADILDEVIDGLRNLGYSLERMD